MLDDDDEESVVVVGFVGDVPNGSVKVVVSGSSASRIQTGVRPIRVTPTVITEK